MQQFPAVWLHPIHRVGELEVGGIEEGLDKITDTKALAEFARYAVETHASFDKGASICTNAAHRLHPDREHRSRLRVTTVLDGTSAPLQLEIFMCELEHLQVVCTDESCGEPMDVIVVGRRQQYLSATDSQDIVGPSGAFGVAWILIVQGGILALHYVMAYLGSCGAIRPDLYDTYELSGVPIGTGSFSSVHTCRSKATKFSGGAFRPVVGAMKMLSSGNEGADTSILALSESALLLQVQQHPNIVGFYDVFRHPSSDGSLIWAVHLEWCPGGDLHTDIIHHGAYEEVRAAAITAGLLSAVAHMHAKGLVHRDVKAENVLIMKDERPVLSDFGIAARLDDKKAMKRRCGSPGYAAPELLAGKEYGAKIDVFSIGVVLYFSASCSMPFAGETIGSILRRTLRCNVKFDPAKFGRVTPCFTKLVLMLLRSDADERPAAEDGWEHVNTLYGEDLPVYYGSLQEAPVIRALHAWMDWKPGQEEDKEQDNRECLVADGHVFSSEKDRISMASTLYDSELAPNSPRITEDTEDGGNFQGTFGEPVRPLKPATKLPFWRRRLQVTNNSRDVVAPAQPNSSLCSRPDRSDRYRFKPKMEEEDEAIDLMKPQDASFREQNDIPQERKQRFRRLSLSSRLKFASKTSTESTKSGISDDFEDRGWQSWNSEASCRVSDRLSSFSSHTSRLSRNTLLSDADDTFTRIDSVREEPEDPLLQEYREEE